MLLQFSIAPHDRNRLVYETDTPIIDNCIRVAFREPNEKARFSGGFVRGKIDPWISAISPLGSFRPGLFFDIVATVQNQFPKMVQIIIPPEVMAIVRPCNQTLETYQPEREEYVLRGYQEYAVAMATKWGKGIFAHATGSGKSLAMYCLIRTMEGTQEKPMRTLIIVPGVGLVQQLHSDFIEYGCPGYKVQKFCSSSDAIPVADIVIANQEYLLPRMKMEDVLDKDGNPVRTEKGRPKKKMTEDIASDRSLDVQGYDMLIVDECQQLKNSDTFIYKYVCKYASKYKFGFSGSIAPTGMARWNVCGALGTVLDEIQPHVLQAAGILSPLHLTVVQFVHSKLPELPREADPDEQKKKAYSVEWKFSESNSFCNEFLADLALLNDNENTIILFDHTAHGQELFRLINAAKDEHIHTFYIDGSVNGKERERIRTFVRAHTNCVIVANSECMSTGINIPNLNNMIFAFSYGEDRDKIMQAAGRVLRCAPGKKFASLYAVCHNLKYSLKHIKEQLSLFDKYYKLGKYEIEKIDVPLSSYK